MHRHELFNLFLNKRKNAKYLEIGVDNPNSTFLNVEAKTKIGVDPYADDSNKCHNWNPNNRDQYLKQIEEAEGTKLERMYSDEYFEKLSTRVKFDLIFIDGLHTAEQVRKDVENATKHLKKGGVIVLDDTHPNNALEAVQNPKPGAPWRGTVYKFVCEERMNPESKYDIFSCKHMNLSVVRPMKPEREHFSRPEFPNPTISFEFFYTFAGGLLNILPHDTFVTKFKSLAK